MPTRISFTVQEEDDHILLTHQAVIEMDLMGYDIVKDHVSNMSCSKTPPGWICTRSEGHEGPCAAHQAT